MTALTMVVIYPAMPGRREEPAVRPDSQTRGNSIHSDSCLKALAAGDCHSRAAGKKRTLRKSSMNINGAEILFGGAEAASIYFATGKNAYPAYIPDEERDPESSI
jgi:hypothetical protein